MSTNPRCAYIVILVLNELRDVPHNNYFRLFASREVVRKSALESLLQTHVIHMNDDITEEEIVWALLAVGNAYNIEMEGVEMENGLTVEYLFEMGDSVRQSLIASASPEERVMGLKPEQVIGMYKPEERVLGLNLEEKRLLMEALQRSMEMDEASENR